MPRFLQLLAPMVLLLLYPTPSFCATLHVGLISFDVLIPAGAGPGINVFNISNLTGDSGSGGFALPPDFSVFTTLTFLNASLTVDDGVSPVLIALVDLAPGTFSPGSLQFPDTSLFVSAIFFASLSQTSLVLDDASTFTAGSPTITIQLLPSSGSTLGAGTDFKLISVNDNNTGIPEPATLPLAVGGISIMAVMALRRKRFDLRRSSRSSMVTPVSTDEVARGL